MTQRYDDANCINDTKATGPGGTLVHLTYDYRDSQGADTALMHQRSDPLNGPVTDYGYSIDRLSSATTTSGGSTTESFSYSYDPNGNATTTNYDYNQDNELTCSHTGSTCGTGATNFSYDGAGNLLGIDGPGTSSDYSFTYNAKEQTTSISPPGAGGAVALSYQDVGEVKLITEGSTRYGYNITGLAAENAGNSGTANTTTYLRDNLGTLVEERVPDMGASTFTHYYYLFDAHGSVLGLTDDSGHLVGGTTYRYDPYGKVLRDPSAATTATNPWTFDAGYRDPQSGLYKFGARYYDQDLMRWTQLDPKAGKASDPMTLDRYLYVEDDPCDRSDPNGQSTIMEGLGGVGCHTPRLCFGSSHLWARWLLRRILFWGACGRHHRSNYWTRRRLRPGRRLTRDLHHATGRDGHTGKYHVTMSEDPSKPVEVVNQRPRTVVIAERCVIPMSLAFVVLAVWWFLEGDKVLAVLSILIALLGPLSIALSRAVYRAGIRAARRKGVTASVSLDVDGPTAVRRVSEAFRGLVPDNEPAISESERTVSTEVPRTRASLGEHITAVIDVHGSASTVEITSYCVGPQAFDHGKNRANVEEVIRTLTSS